MSSSARLSRGAPERDLHLFLGLAPRRLGKADLVLTAADLAAADAARPGWRPAGWSIDGAARVLALLTHAKSAPVRRASIATCAAPPTRARLVALYRGLPLYPDPERLDSQVGEGLRSNMRAVFEAIAHRNPFPREHFDEHRWNHMVLKALFIGSRAGADPGPRRARQSRARPDPVRLRPRALGGGPAGDAGALALRRPVRRERQRCSTTSSAPSASERSRARAPPRWRSPRALAGRAAGCSPAAPRGGGDRRRGL